jgi:hypothetical protein
MFGQDNRKVVSVHLPITQDLATQIWGKSDVNEMVPSQLGTLFALGQRWFLTPLTILTCGGFDLRVPRISILTHQLGNKLGTLDACFVA